MYRILAMERLYGTGGREVCEKVAERLGVKLYDKNILSEAAERLDVPAVYIKDLEETVQGSLLFNLYQTSLGGVSDRKNLPLSEKVFLEEKAVIEEKAEKESFVILGRCASWILRGREDVLRVFLYADTESRIKRTMEYEKTDEVRSENLMHKNDKRRHDFYEAHTDAKWEAKSGYDLCLNSAALGIDKCVDIIVSMMKK